MNGSIVDRREAFDLIDTTILITGKHNEFNSNTLAVSDGTTNYSINEIKESVVNSIKRVQAKVKIPIDSIKKLNKLYLISNSKDKIPLTYTPDILENYDQFWLHKVGANDSLPKLAKKYYGELSKWNLIYRSNLDRIENAAIIYEGQILRIPRE